MTSKKEEKAAFEKLKKLFPNREVALECKYCNWIPHPVYYAYASGKGEDNAICTISTRHLTPKDAIDDLISQRKEVTKDQNQEAKIINY